MKTFRPLVRPVGNAARVGSLVLILALASGCARIRPDLAEPPAPGGHVMTGVASWYGPDFHGRPTSSQEVYDMNDMTAAHKTLPFGTWVLVTNLDNGRSVSVRINDRGPFVEGRIIDLSYAAARMLGVVGPGTAPVRLELLDAAAPLPPAQRYAVQVGAFADKDNAARLRGTLAESFADVSVSTLSAGGRVYYRVRIGAKSREEAAAIALRLAALGRPALIVEPPPGPPGPAGGAFSPSP
jgi:rare lipoprotein A